MSVAHYWFLSGMVSSSLNAYSFLVLMDFICTTCGRWSEFVSEMLVMYRPGEEGTCLCLTFINPDADWEELKGLLPEGCADLEKRKQRSKWFSFTNQGFRYMSCVYWPLLTAVFSCLQIVPPMNKMKGAKNEKSGKSGKKLQFYWKCTFIIFLSEKIWFSRYFLIKPNINKDFEKSFIEIYSGNVAYCFCFDFR